MLDGAIIAQRKILYRNSPGGTVENHEKSYLD